MRLKEILIEMQEQGIILQDLQKESEKTKEGGLTLDQKMKIYLEEIKGEQLGRL